MRDYDIFISDDLHIAVHRAKLKKLYIVWMIFDIGVAMVALSILTDTVLLYTLLVLGILVVSHLVMYSHFYLVDKKLRDIYDKRLTAGSYTAEWWDKEVRAWNTWCLNAEGTFTTYITEYCSAVKTFISVHLVVVLTTFYLLKSDLIVASLSGIAMMVLTIIDFNVFKTLITKSFEEHSYKRPY